jgi:hypothetical protein
MVLKTGQIRLSRDLVTNRTSRRRLVETRVGWPQLVSYWTKLAGDPSNGVNLIYHYSYSNIGEQFIESTIL